MNDVAQRAGVSLKAVSRVVNEESGASQQTRNRVRAAIRDLGYQRNDTAHTLRRRDGRSVCLGVVLDDVSNSFAATVNRGVEEVAHAQGSLVLAASTNGDPRSERQLVHRLLARAVDGLVIMSARSDHTYLRPELERGMPIVFVDRPARGIKASSVVAANRSGAREAVEQLIAHGHHRIAFLSDWPALYTTAERRQGYLDAHHARGLTIRNDLIRSGLVDDAAARDDVTTLMSSNRPPTAVFAANNLTCVRVLRALHRRGLMGKLAVIGFDDIELADALHPPLTVVRQDPATIGRVAAEIIFTQLAGLQSAPQERQIPVVVVARGSGELAGPATPIRQHARSRN
jgi:LacI family transcriptional regulator